MKRRLLALSIITVFMSQSCEQNNVGPTVSYPESVYISDVVASPTASESITLRNGTDGEVDISSWTLGDKADSLAFKIPANTIMGTRSVLTYKHTELGFDIDDSKEILYLKNTKGETINTWKN